MVKKNNSKKHPGGRPSIFTDKLAETICRRIAQGETLLQISRDPKMPNRDTVYQWLLDPRKKKFSDMYAEAKNSQAEHMFEEILDIAEDGSNDWMEREFENGRIVDVPDHEHINRSRLRVDTRKWYLSKVLPKKYGESLNLDGKITHDHFLTEVIKKAGENVG